MGINIKGVTKCAAVSIVLTFVLLLILSLLAYFTRINETVITVGAYVSVIVGSLAGSWLAALSAPSKKLLHALIVSVLYTLILVVLSLAINGAVTFNAHMAAVIGGIFAASFLGLILGGSR